MSFKAGSFQIEELIRAGLLEIGDGYRAKNSELSEAGIPFARAANINDGFKFNAADFFPLDSLSKVGNKVSRPGDVVFTSKGTVGRFALVEAGTQQFVYSPQLCFWRSLAQSKLLPEFLYYWMNSIEFLNQIGYLKGQTDMADYVSLRDQRKITATIPDTDTQREIVDILKPIDDRIVLLRETNATLEAIAQALFKSWFVDFDPVHAKLQSIDSPQGGRRGLYGPKGPTTAQPEGLDEATAALFPDGFEESELGLVPRGWRVASIYEVADVIYGAPFASKKFNTEKIGKPLIRIRDLRDEMSDIYTDEVHPKGYMIQPGDIVVGMDGEFRAYLWGGEPAWLNQRVCVFAPKQGVPSVFVHRTIVPLLAQIEATETATTVIHLGKNDIDRFKVVAPHKSVFEAFEAITSPLYARIVKNKQTVQTLANLRDTLLPRLISGQLRLPETT